MMNIEKDRESFSVLMSTYIKDNPVFLSEALGSLSVQTLLPNEVVLVLDGPIPDETHQVIKKFVDLGCLNIKVCALSENKGLGEALAYGLNQTSYDLVARMDADDIAKPERFEKQITFLVEHPEVDILGSWVDEFSDNPQLIDRVKTVPQTHQEIAHYLCRRNPINHPTVLFRKNSVLAVGNYQDFYLNEDYYLWIRMYKNGAQFYNLNESLVYFRVSQDTYRKRGGIKYFKQDIVLQKALYHIGLINKGMMFLNLLLRLPVRLTPNIVRERLYKVFLRKQLVN
ncbi:glycosyltransferase [Neisseria sp. Ec49-e6-T10]|uniref:glycosyltransferase n=1 Tax=Neisseria sp. Ec49-e6-T10 TaxID=3140744 RepID=UPI003EC017DC